MKKDNCLEKKQEMFQYIVWGILSTLLNVGLFQLLICFKIEYRIANAITLTIVKVFSYITNKLFVFRTPYIDLIHLLKEMGAFILARGFTFILDFIGVIIMVDFVRSNAFFSKCLITIIVIILNYILSKKFVFYKG